MVRHIDFKMIECTLIQSLSCFRSVFMFWLFSHVLICHFVSCFSSCICWFFVLYFFAFFRLLIFRSVLSYLFLQALIFCFVSLCLSSCMCWSFILYRSIFLLPCVEFSFYIVLSLLASIDFLFCVALPFFLHVFNFGSVLFCFLPSTDISICVVLLLSFAGAADILICVIKCFSAYVVL